MGAHATVIEALRRAVTGSPDDTELRLHLADLLVEDEQGEDALAHLGFVLAQEPANTRARELMRRALTPTPSPGSEHLTGQGAPQRADPAMPASADAPSGDDFDWTTAESQVAGIAAPAFLDGATAGVAAPLDLDRRPPLRLSDVGGMETVKKRLNASFLLPLRNPKLSRLYDKSLRGGLLLYGPPGCGKTFVARAVAGELGARFLTISISDVLDPLFGQSERNVHEVFQYARREAPCVLFIDEVDALGARRNSTTSDLLRGVVNQILMELDGVGADNEGVFVLAATNQPWDVDPALRRPGRLDRTVLVAPPDEDARRAIFRHHLEGRPVEGVDLGALARASGGLSGADIAYVCEVAAETALEQSVEAGEARMIGMDDLTSALREVTPSTVAWLNSARNFIEYGRRDPAFDELRKYLKRTHRG